MYNLLQLHLIAPVSAADNAVRDNTHVYALWLQVSYPNRACPDLRVCAAAPAQAANGVGLNPIAEEDEVQSGAAAKRGRAAAAQQPKQPQPWKG
jgi:hypothetical protein